MSTEEKQIPEERPENPEEGGDDEVRLLARTLRLLRSDISSFVSNAIIPRNSVK
jgi:hypothetical protein